jgi:hypothetical protein
MLVLVYRTSLGEGYAVAGKKERPSTLAIGGLVSIWSEQLRVCGTPG